MNIKNVTIAGAGLLGSQVAWQVAFNGFNVTVYDYFDKGLATSKAFHKEYAALFMSTRGATQAQVDKALAGLNYTSDLAEAVKDADLISESIPESIDIKKSFYSELSKVDPQKTIFTTNSSTLVPSQIVDSTDRPDKFLALHFGNTVWDSRIGEVMGHPETCPEIYKVVCQFSKAMGMVTIPLHKEQSGYVINAIMIPWLNASLDLVVNQVAGFESVDKTWMLAHGVKHGPFAVMDIVGISLFADINKLWGEQLEDDAALARVNFLEENYVSQNKFGAKANEGFYSYPNPAYKDASFIK
ncbi:3-hydroxybutyryl-CoA dehydrogenase [Sinobacterium norvegicum]|uniref:3-hydroxybutyryl-CoA dehydrogenase n=1 Tax=Sinobacterium norvegicum TaxID=1641715 RepID=A0ABM9ACV0_9GAMM|nr:3-hydroxyacyl-CoA dehydrogenase [Sinobacterium norvegicum]CAH0990999.1 3-hydroxybutyryl-CoA dehydrogenase [Sinobacterium norvegicum]